MDGDSITRMHENHSHWLQVEINSLRRELTGQSEEIESLRQENDALRAENKKLKQRIDDLMAKASPSVRAVPAFVNPNPA